MAGDWIKMRADLHTDPDVARIAAALAVDRYSVIGRLHAFWSWADKHAVDGRVDGATPQFVDEIVQTQGYAQALSDIGWLKFDAKGLVIPKFERHNGSSAKQRALKNQRQARWRIGNNPQSTDASTSPSTAASTREEKRREDIKPPYPLSETSRSTPKAAAHSIARAQQVIEDQAKAQQDRTPMPEALQAFASKLKPLTPFKSKAEGEEDLPF
jgi:hypothetical protein